jgi:undecaprenyl-diphosphatase
MFGIPFYLLFIYLIFKIYSLKKALRVIAIIGITVGLGDLIAHDLIKETVQRFRPSHHLEVSKYLNFVNEYKGGTFGFVSNHATNMSIVGIMIYNVIKNLYPKSWIYLLIFVVLISYSRIYLGVHYLSDIIGGWTLGFVLSFLGSKYINKFILKL